MDKRQEAELQPLAERKRKLYTRALIAEKKKNDFDNKRLDFNEKFIEKKELYLVQGIICLCVLIFDFWVSEKSLGYLSILISVRVQYLAFIFCLVDGGLSILSSGGLAGNDITKAKFMKRLWKPILITLGVVKLALFIIFVYEQYTSYDIVTGEKYFNLDTIDFLKLIIPQFFFLVIIYGVLSFAGFGLLYVIGNSVLFIWGLMLDSPEKIRAKLYEAYNDFINKVNYLGCNLHEAIEHFKLSEIVSYIKRYFSNAKN